MIFFYAGRQTKMEMFFVRGDEVVLVRFLLFFFLFLLHSYTDERLYSIKRYTTIEKIIS